MFKEIPVTKKSIANKRPVYGVGNNDANYLISVKTDGRLAFCPFYRAWTSMLQRCYSSKYQKSFPTYIGCSVCDKWLTFSNFKAWMEAQGWQGKQLDKDIVIDGNKIYSPETCIFVSQEINKLLLDRAATRGEWPQGVSFVKNKFQSTCSMGLKHNKNLGRFDTPEAASLAYRRFKSQIIFNVAKKQIEPLKSYLNRIAEAY